MSRLNKKELVSAMIKKIKNMAPESGVIVSIDPEAYPGISENMWQEIISFLVSDGYSYTEAPHCNAFRFWKE